MTWRSTRSTTAAAGSTAGRARDGARPQLGELTLLPGELLPRGALDDAAPDHQKLHEASGNEGVTLERAYRRASFVMWPRSKTLAILASAGVGRAVAWLAAELDRNTGVADERIGRLASELIDIWPPGRAGQDKQSRARMLSLLSAAGDEERIARFLHEVALLRYSGSENEDLVTAMEMIGPNAAKRFLLDLTGAHFAQRPKEILALLRRLGETPGEFASPTWDAMLLEAVRAVLLAVSAAPAPRTQADSAPPTVEKPASSVTLSARTQANPAPTGGDSRRLKRFDDQAVRDLFILAWRWRLTREAETAARAIAGQPQIATPDRALPAALRELYGEEGLADTASFATLWRHASGFLLQRSAAPPEEPRHWTIATDIPCKCKLCDGLRAFCKDPTAKTARFPLRQDLRAHLHHIIDIHRLDIDHETERRGRPYTLVCTKNRASHKRRLAVYSKDLSWMRRLIRSVPGGAQAAICAPDIARLHEAVAASGQG